MGSYELTIEATFSAAHAIVIAGKREPVHGHDWHVTACFAGETLDSDGLLCDFHALERELERITSAYHNGSLNEIEPFVSGVNPTAERVAQTIAEQLDAQTSPIRPTSVSLSWVCVTEAPGCAAMYRVGPKKIR